MIDLTHAVLGFILAGALGGFVLSIIGWLNSEKKFNNRKNIAALLTGTLSGMVLGIFTTGGQTEGIPEYMFVTQFFLIFLAAAGFTKLAQGGTEVATHKGKKHGTV